MNIFMHVYIFHVFVDYGLYYKKRLIYHKKTNQPNQPNQNIPIETLGILYIVYMYFLSNNQSCFFYS